MKKENILERIKALENFVEENSEIFNKVNDEVAAMSMANLSSQINQDDLEKLEDGLKILFSLLMDFLLINYKSHVHCADTPKRIAKMYLREILVGRYHQPPKLIAYPNTGTRETCVVGPMKVRSLCAHHFLPVYGYIWIGIRYDKHVLGLSKFKRIIDWYFSAPCIQEEVVCGLADFIEESIHPSGLAIAMKAHHSCMLWRGVRAENTYFTTFEKRGEFQTSETLWSSFLSMIELGKGF